MDTGVLLTEVVGNAAGSRRSLEAISRINSLHAPYQKAGKISDDDMLYTLSLFACEPARWIAKYEWRDLSAIELCAIGVVWKAVGQAMGIDYAVLLGGKTGWADGVEWLDGIRAWSEEYEAAAMLPSETNHRVTEETLNLLLWMVPASWKPFGHQVVATLMDERLRRAMM